MDDYSSDSSENSWKWINWFLSLKGNEFFCKVEEEYILDRFNLTGLNTEAPNYQTALNIILDQFDQQVSEDVHNTLERNARHLYGLIHARYITTSSGISKMLAKYKAGDFGRCPRVMCYSQALFPVGLSDIPYETSVKLYCPRCEDVYLPKSQRHALIDGAYFGTTFPHMLLLHYPMAMPQKTSERYEPRIFGFKVHEYAVIHRKQDEIHNCQLQRLQNFAENEEQERLQSIESMK